MEIYILAQVLLALLLTLLSVFVGWRAARKQADVCANYRMREFLCGVNESHALVNFAAILVWLLVVSAVIAYVTG